VQRVPPKTEKNGRRHTSTITVAVLKIQDVKDVKVRREDVEFSACRAGGCGGQNVNKRSTAVRLVHKQTGEVVSCREERQQGQNRDRALTWMEERLNDERKKKHKRKEDETRKSQVGCGMRGDKVRTYNFRENRVTNHLTGKSVKRLDEILESGRIDLIR